MRTGLCLQPWSEVSSNQPRSRGPRRAPNLRSLGWPGATQFPQLSPARERWVKLGNYLSPGRGGTGSHTDPSGRRVDGTKEKRA